MPPRGCTTTEPTRILLVEDNPGDARLVELDLAQVGGFHLETATTLAAALTRLAAGGIELVLLDLTLPDGSGSESVAKVREQAPQIPVVVVTGADDERSAQNALGEGAQDFLVKGRFDARTLERAIRYARLRQRFVETEEQFRRMIEATPDPVSLNDLESGEYIQVNDGWCRFTGIPREEAIARPVATLGFWAEQSELRSFVRALETDGQVRSFEAQFRVRSGLRFGSVSATILVLGGRRRVLASTRDVTEQRRIESMRRDLVAMLSHDIKNPLGIVLGFTEVLREKLLEGEEVGSEIDAIEASAREAMSLALNFLDADRIDGGALQLRRKRTSMNRVVEHVLGHQAARARRRNVELRTVLDPMMPHLAVDEPLIDRAIANLVSNAIKFSPRGGAVTTTTIVEEGLLRIEVRDQGAGISAEEQPKLFQRYARGSSEDPSATGLGLFVVRTIVEAHGGLVRMSCSEEGGSVFAILLPVAAD